MKYIVVPLIIITVLSLPNLGFSQSSMNSTAGGEKEVRLASPILQKVSDKGTYLVTKIWTIISSYRIEYRDSFSK